jgi:hypothetical protein
MASYQGYPQGPQGSAPDATQGAPQAPPGAQPGAPQQHGAPAPPPHGAPPPPLYPSYYYPPPGAPAVVVYGTSGASAPVYLQGAGVGAGAVVLPAPPAPQPDCCGGGGGGGCCGGAQPPALGALSEPLTLAAYALQSHGGVALGLGILFLFSTGWTLLSSVMLIAQGALLRASGGSAAALQAALADAAAVPPRKACCGRTRNGNARGLAIAGIVFAVCECLLGLGLGLGLGIGLLRQPLTSGNSRLSVCGAAVPSGQQLCLSSVTSASVLWSRDADGTPYSIPLSLLRTGDVRGSQYLLWAAGTTFFTGIVNIALSTHTMYLCKAVEALGAAGAPPRM